MRYYKLISRFFCKFGDNYIFIEEKGLMLKERCGCCDIKDFSIMCRI